MSRAQYDIMASFNSIDYLDISERLMKSQIRIIIKQDVFTSLGQLPYTAQDF